MAKVGVQIDGTMVLVALVAVGVGYAYYKKNEIVKTVTEDLNPTHQNNIINRGVQGALGRENVSSVADKIFAAADILTPWNGISGYAKEVWGLK